MKYYFFISCVLILASCKPILPEVVYIKEPLLEPKNSYLANEFVEKFFNEIHFSYKDGVQLDSNGKFSYVLPDGTVDNTFLDTKQHYHTSETIILSNKKRLYLRSSEAILLNDTLALNVTDTPFSNNWYELSVTKTKKNLLFKCYQTTFILDSSYRPPEFSVIEQSFIPNKEFYQKGDTLKAKIVAKIAVLHTWDSVYRDTLTIFGLIKTLVK